MDPKTIFLTASAPEELPAIQLLIDSLRSFGGELDETLFWVFTSNPAQVTSFRDERTRILPLIVPNPVSAYPFGYKVAACARAEELAPSGTRSLVWIDPFCLVVQPPILFELGTEIDAAFRPVHIRNIGLPPSEPLDTFWQGICAALGVDDIHSTVTSFVDGQLLRSYFNSHAFAINPTLGLMHRWYEFFLQLLGDASFQSKACTDERHQIFLFQALLSTLVTTTIEPSRVRILPPTYNYPLHLQDRIPDDRRLQSLNDTVCFTYEDHCIHPDVVTGIMIREPLRAWLAARTTKS